MYSQDIAMSGFSVIHMFHLSIVCRDTFYSNSLFAVQQLREAGSD